MVGSTFMTQRYALGLHPSTSLHSAKTHQEKEKVWSWFSEHSKRAIFEMSWQQHEDGVDRVALSLQSHKVGLIDLTRIPALQKSRAAS
jgi:transducin (beta)-like 1